MDGGCVQFGDFEEFGHFGGALRGKVAHVSYYEKTMSSSREGYGGDLVIKDEFVRFYVEFI